MVCRVLSLLFALATIAGVIGAPVKAGRAVIGYRRVNPEQAKRYSDAGTITDDPTGNGGEQIGHGVYTSAITAEKDVWDKLPKTWIPRSEWWKNDDVDAYIKTVDSSLKPEDTVRLALIDKIPEEQLQMLLPKALLKNQDLRIETKCGNDIQDSPPVDYGTWGNIKGNRFTRSETKAREVIQEILDSVVKIKAANEKVKDAKTPEEIETLSKEAKENLDKAKESTEKLAKVIEGARGVKELAVAEGAKQACKDCTMDHKTYQNGFSAYREARREHASFVVKSAERGLSLVAGPGSGAENTGSAKALKDLAARVEKEVESKRRNKQLIKDELDEYEKQTKERLNSKDIGKVPPNPPESGAENIFVTVSGRVRALNDELGVLENELAILDGEDGVLRKLCKGPNSGCKAQSNPETDEDEPPRFYGNKKKGTSSMADKEQDDDDDEPPIFDPKNKKAASSRADEETGRDGDDESEAGRKKKKASSNGSDEEEDEDDPPDFDVGSGGGQPTADNPDNSDEDSDGRRKAKKKGSGKTRTRVDSGN
ncbi:hypothetical protein CDD83_1380 [Cordyceps sp. RAO-2017]|nr:hypothetical protein CDD83_1380 [Cordyceps sp. RAO-2017]